MRGGARARWTADISRAYPIARGRRELVRRDATEDIDGVARVGGVAREERAVGHGRDAGERGKGAAVVGRAIGRRRAGEVAHLP